MTYPPFSKWQAMDLLRIDHLQAGGVIVNYHCVSQCGHCLYNCGPRRSRDYLDGRGARTIFQRIKALGAKAVHIGGGEPLLAPEKLLAVVQAARQAGVEIDYVETNSAWFTGPGPAQEILKALQAAGVHTLLISMSPFHNAAIPFARVLGVMAACRQVGMDIFPWVNAFVRDLDRMDHNQPHTMAEFEAAFGPDYLERIPQRYWIHPGGRALATFRSVWSSYPLERILANAPASCAPALKDTSHFHVDLYGNYIPGLCAGLAVELAALGMPLPAKKYPLIDQLAACGVRGLLALAQSDHGYRPRSGGYLNHCDLCTHIRFFLHQCAGDAFEELAPSGFYEEGPVGVG